MPDSLIVRLPNWLGDTVMAVPALRALRHAFADARVLAAGPWSGVLIGQGLADVLVTYPRGWAGRVRVADSVRDFRGEVAVLLSNSFEAAAAAWYWRARRRVGFGPGGRGWLLTDPVPLPSPRLHQIDEYLRLLAPLGVRPLDREPRLAPPDAASDTRRDVRERLAAVGVRRDATALVVGVHLGAAYGSSKLWPSARVSELCRRLMDDGDVPVLLGAADSAGVADEIVEATPVASLVGRDSPALLTAVLTEVDVLVGGDTGVTHLAAALGTPVVALFGPTDPALSAPRGRAAVVRHAVPCAPCFYRTCPIDHPCMRSIDAATVRERVRELAAREERVEESRSVPAEHGRSERGGG